MKTIALRFGEHFSPSCGTIMAHEEILNNKGYGSYYKYKRELLLENTEKRKSGSG